MDVAALYHEHQEGLLRYLSRLSGDPDLAADAMHEAFVRIQQRPPRQTENLRAWLYTVATNVVRDITRAKRHHRELLVARPERVVADGPVDPARAAELEERKTRVRRALAALSEKERTTLLMREEGFAHHEIAAAVGTTTKSVGTLIARSLDKLARELTLDEEDL